MIRLLADHNFIYQAKLIWSVLSAVQWHSLGVAGWLQFRDLGLPMSASDREVWRACQSHRLLLLTANRNADGDDSLTAVIEELNDSQSLPVLTIGRADRVEEFPYREDCAYRIGDIASAMELFLGTARLFIA